MALLEAAFEGVSYAHQQGEVHLSLNPSNLFLATKVEGGVESQGARLRGRQRHERHVARQDAGLPAAGDVAARAAGPLPRVRRPRAARPGRGPAGAVDRRLRARPHHPRGALRPHRDVRARSGDPHRARPRRSTPPEPGGARAQAAAQPRARSHARRPARARPPPQERRRAVEGHEERREADAIATAAGGRVGGGSGGLGRGGGRKQQRDRGVDPRAHRGGDAGAGEHRERRAAEAGDVHGSKRRAS